MRIRNALLLFLLTLPTRLPAHPGGIDNYGCHNETATATYHCHAGNYAGMSFNSKTEALAFFALQEEEGLAGVTVNTSAGVYRVTTVIGTLVEFRDTLRSQAWFTGDALHRELADEFAGAVAAQLGVPNIRDFFNTRIVGPYFVYCTYPDVPCSSAFNTSDWDPGLSLVTGAGIGGGASEIIYTFAVANALPTATLAGGDRTIPDTDGLPGEKILISVDASDPDSRLAKIGGVFHYAGSPPLTIPEVALDGNSSTISVAAELPFPDGENVITLWVADEAGVKGSATVILTVEGAAEHYEYDREEYLKDWGDDDGDCINTRHEVLAIESIIEPAFDDDGCRVIAGLWQDPYTGAFFTDPSELDIDHLVPLKEAHDSGARFWTPEQKQAFANDNLMANALIAVDALANRQKGADDPARWLPPNQDYHCAYVRNWVTIKNAYGLDFDIAEREAIEAILDDDIRHATGVTQQGITLGGEQSSARFSLGMTRNDGCAFYTEAAASDRLTIQMSITPEAQHLGRRSSIYLLAVIDAQLFAISSAGEVLPIEADPEQLVEFTSLEFYESVELTLYEGYLAPGFDATFYIGYWPEGGELIFTPGPIPLTIH